jgi:hypothetical protein
VAEFDDASIEWRTSTRSAGGNCVEIAFTGGRQEVLVRHSRSPEGGVLRFTAPTWQQFMDALRAGNFDTD